MSEVLYSVYDSETMAKQDIMCCDVARGKWEKAKRLIAAVKECVPHHGYSVWWPDKDIQFRYCPHCGKKYGVEKR